MDQYLCVSDCSRVFNCKLITFNKFNNICKYYRYYLSSQTALIKSNGDFVYNYQIDRYTYNLIGVLYKTVPVGCQVISLITLPGDNLSTGCWDAKIKI